MNLEKIQKFNREKIIMACHPECKTLEEATAKEFKNLRWNIKETYSDTSSIGSNCEDYTNYIIFSNLYKILYKPLTLSRVLNSIERQLHLKCINSYIEKVNGIEIKNEMKMSFEFMKILRDWELLNEDGTDCLLEQQPEETQYAIAKLLGYMEGKHD